MQGARINPDRERKYSDPNQRPSMWEDNKIKAEGFYAGRGFMGGVPSGGRYEPKETGRIRNYTPEDYVFESQRGFDTGGRFDIGSQPEKLLRETPEQEMRMREDFFRLQKGDRVVRPYPNRQHIRVRKLRTKQREQRDRAQSEF